ncbi:MAG: Thymidylate kinase [Chlamydiia bacterium]|nr:Thymidylate kinase [Chlamydiia bacterium]MCH9615434.1 Thymidylate kinase [Chlamydiia bacterium]MCH9628244.1 Thymidylate kinase [Chlamydiia bacterium]
MKKMSKNNGLFVTIEGGDGSGKSTLIERIFDTLTARGFNVLKTRAPGGCKLGLGIRELLLHSDDITAKAELFLYLADRAEHVEKVILPALSDNKIVLCDRFNDSTIAYQGGARNLELLGFCEFAAGKLTPHLTLYLDVDAKIGLSRVKGEKDRLEREDLSFHENVRKGYLELAEQNKERIRTLNANLSSEEVFQNAIELINTKLSATLCLM